MFSNMKARLIFDRRVLVSETAYAELVLWQVPLPVPGSAHNFKFRLALVSKGTCVLRYDNEAGQGGHIHSSSGERAYAFTGIDQLLADFSRDVERWRDENSDT